MLKKNLTWTDVDGKQHSDTFHFHLGKADVLKYELLFPGGDFASEVKRIVGNTKEDPKALIELFEGLIHKAYGERDAGNNFLKSKDMSDRFQQTDAYSELFFELCTNAGSAEEFFNGIMPVAEMSEAVKAARPALKDHMQKHVKPTATSETLPTFREDEEPKQPVDDEYAEFQAFKAAREAQVKNDTERGLTGL